MSGDFCFLKPRGGGMHGGDDLRAGPVRLIRNSAISALSLETCDGIS